MEAARLARLARPEVKSVRCVVVGDKLDSAKTKSATRQLCPPKTTSQRP